MTEPGTGAAVLVLAPLRIEARALRAGAPGMQVVRLGAGPSRAGATAGRLARQDRPGSRDGPDGPGGAAAVVVAGVAGALVEGLVPGDLVVADRVLDAAGALVEALPSAGPVAAALRRAGLPTRVGAVITTGRLVRGRAARATLALHGALAVDMESAVAIRQDWGRPLAVVRAIADTPERDLVSPATVRGGVAALRALRAAAPVLADWGGALPGLGPVALRDRTTPDGSVHPPPMEVR